MKGELCTVRAIQSWHLLSVGEGRTLASKTVVIWRLLFLVLGLLSLAAAGGAPVSPEHLPAGSAALTVGQPQEAASAIREQSERSTFKVAPDASPSAVVCDPLPDLPPAAARELELGDETFIMPRPASGRAARARAPPAMG